MFKKYSQFLRQHLNRAFKRPPISFNKKLTAKEVVESVKNGNYYHLRNLFPRLNFCKRILSRTQTVLFYALMIGLGLFLSKSSGNPLPLFFALGIAYSSEYVFNTGTTYTISTALIDSTHFVVAYQDAGNGYQGTAVIGTISGDSISYGSEYIFNSASTGGISVRLLDSTHIVIVFRDNGNSNYGTAIIGTISGSSISFGSEYVFSAASTIVSQDSACVLDSTHFVAAYQSTSNYGRAIVGTVSGSSISFGSEYVFNSGYSSTYISTLTLDSTHFVVVYNTSETNRGASIVGTVSGSSISYGSQTLFLPDSSSIVISSAVIDSTHFVIAYQRTFGGSYGYAVIGTVSGTTISYGSAYQFNSTSTSNISVDVLDSSHLVISFRDGGNTRGYSIVGSFSGSVISFGSKYAFNLANTIEISLIALNSSKFITAYDDGGNGGYGTAIIGTYTPPPPTVTTQAVSGISQNSATGNGTITDTGEGNCDKRGFVYSTTSHGDPGNVAPGSSGYSNYVEDTGSFGTGAFTKALSGLSAGTKYYVRAYAHSSGGYAYGSEVRFITNLGINESLSLNDSANKKVGLLMNELIDVVDSIKRQTAHFFNETITIVDSVKKFLARTFSEAIGLFGNLKNSISKNLSETMLITEDLSKQGSLTFSETPQVADSLNNKTVLLFNEAALITDSFIKNISQVFKEAINIVESSIKATVRIFSEAIQTLDVLLNMPIKIFSEVISVVDALSRQIGKIINELINIVDEIKKQGKKIITETVQIVDSFLKNIGQVLSETISVIGNFIGKTMRSFSETINISDWLETITVFVKELQETISILPSLTIRFTSKVFNETINVLDTLQKKLACIFSDAVQIVDTSLNMATKVISEAVQVVDNIFRETGKVIVETITIVSSFAQIITAKIFFEIVSIGAAIQNRAAKIFSDRIILNRSPYALNFDGTDDFVDCGNGVSLDITESLTLEAWVEWENTPNWSEMVIWKGVYQLRIAGSNVEFIIKDSDADQANQYDNVILTSSISIQEKKLTHLVAVYDYPTRTMKIYINSQFAGSLTTTGGDGRIETGNSLFIGRALNGNFFKGLIDQARIYRRALIEPEIAEHFAGIFKDESNLAGLWQMDEGDGDTISDSSGNNNHGTIDGAQWIKGGAPIKSMFTGVSRIFIQGISVIGSLTAGIVGKILSETTNITDSIKQGILKILFETVNIIGSQINKTITAFTESLKIIASGLNQAGKIINEAVAIIDSFKNKAAKVLSETLEIVSLINQKIFSIFQETIQISDNVFKQTGRILSQTISIADTLKSGAIKVLNEAITVLDISTKTIGRIFSEVLHITGTVFKKAGRVLSQTLSLVQDFLAHRTAYQICSETISLIESFIKQTFRVLKESISVVARLFGLLNGINMRYSHKYKEKIGSYFKKYFDI